VSQADAASRDWQNAAALMTGYPARDGTTLETSHAIACVGTAVSMLRSLSPQRHQRAVQFFGMVVSASRGKGLVAPEAHIIVGKLLHTLASEDVDDNEWFEAAAALSSCYQEASNELEQMLCSACKCVTPDLDKKWRKLMEQLLFERREIAASTNGAFWEVVLLIICAFASCQELRLVLTQSGASIMLTVVLGHHVGRPRDYALLAVQKMYVDPYASDSNKHSIVLMHRIVGLCDAVLGVIYSRNCRHHTRAAAGLAIHAIMHAQLPMSLAESCCEVIDQVTAVPLCHGSSVQELVVLFVTYIFELLQAAWMHDDVALGLMASLFRRSSRGRLQASLTVGVRHLGEQLANSLNVASTSPQAHSQDLHETVRTIMHDWLSLWKQKHLSI